MGKLNKEICCYKDEPVMENLNFSNRPKITTTSLCFKFNFFEKCRCFTKMPVYEWRYDRESETVLTLKRGTRYLTKQLIKM